MGELSRSIGRKIGVYYNFTLHPPSGFPFMWVFNQLLSRASIDEASLAKLQELSQKGVVIYALKNKSQLNCLILRSMLHRAGVSLPVYCHGINMVLWQPAFKALRALFSTFFHNPFKRRYLSILTEEKQSSVLYLRGSEFFGSKYPKDPLTFLIDVHDKVDVPVFIIPTLLVYGRQREKKERTITDLLFGEAENPSTLRRLITFFRFSKTALVILSDPINLSEFMASHHVSTPATVNYLLRRELIERIDTEKRSIVGPVMKSREEIISMVLRDPEFEQFAGEMTATGKKKYQDIVKDAKKSLYEIAADYSETSIGLFNILLTWLWNNIFDGVVIDKEGIAKLRNISKRMPFVVIPCHRSHIDYLLLSYVLYHNNIQLPFIAAGNNLLFWPMGQIFRKSGAFFMRRSFRGDPVYAKVFALYIKILIKEGFPIEFFIEGGRSRTGKMVMPKYGLLSMIIQAYRSGICDDLAIVPVFIGYDRVVEEKSYTRELEGAEKQKENTTDLIRSSKVLRKRYGSVYLNIGEPITLKAYMEAQTVAMEQMGVADRQRFYRKMSYEIAREINEISVVTPYSLVATGLLCHYRRGISYDELISYISELIEYLKWRNVQTAATLSNRYKALNDALTQFETSHLISKMGPEEDEEDEFAETIYSVPEERRLGLEYYKNNILHFFLPVSFVATSILSSDTDEISLYKIYEDFVFFKKLFRHEFIFDDSIDNAAEMNLVLSYLRDQGMIAGYETGDRGWIELKGKGRRTLIPFAGLIHNYIESYWITVRGCSYLRTKVRPEKDMVKRIQKLGLKMFKKGEVSKAEALSQSNYQSALRYLIDNEIVYVSYGKDAKEGKLLSLTEDRILFESLRRRLFNFMT